ncbi:hypothetical protein AB1L88_02005 [Tautonia sp. JC769]|uniref:copper amine oxidase n=1 Tax=Tautonia sp. JC769 TaxID=3232135 RepID=UPI0034579F3F
MTRRRQGRLALQIALLFTAPALSPAATIQQHFPADGPESAGETRWRIEWSIERHAGGSETLVIRNAWFSRAPGDEVHVLGDTRVAEIFVPYHNGNRIYDISNFGFRMVDLSPRDLGPMCITPGMICDRSGNQTQSGPVAVEVHDDSVRWMDTANRTRRGQKLEIWCALDAANYRYVMLYEFRDDGSIRARLGATASNLYSSNDDGTTHLHCPIWRINPVLGGRDQLLASEVGIDTNRLRTESRPIREESDFPFEPRRFTKLRVENPGGLNGHSPPNPIGYELIPTLSGTGRYFGLGEEFTRSDFWVTRGDLGELRPRDLPSYSNGEPLIDQPITLWHMAGALHIARDEDFGPVDYDSSDGLAIVAWAGFELKPRNLFSSTPLFP